MSEEVEELLVQARLADAALSLDERKSAAPNATPIAEFAIAAPLKPVERVMSTLKLLGVQEETSRAAASRVIEEPNNGQQSGHVILDEAAITAAFERIDVNGSGTLSRIEIIKACRNDLSIRTLLGLPRVIRQEDGTRDQFEQVFQRFDADDSKSIDKFEFLKAFQTPSTVTAAASTEQQETGSPSPSSPSASQRRLSSMLTSARKSVLEKLMTSIASPAAAPPDVDVLASVQSSLVTIESVRNALAKAEATPPAASRPTATTASTMDGAAAEWRMFLSLPRTVAHPHTLVGLENLDLAASGAYAHSSRGKVMRRWTAHYTEQLGALRRQNKVEMALVARGFQCWRAMSLEWKRSRLAGWEWSKGMRESLSMVALAEVDEDERVWRQRVLAIAEEKASSLTAAQGEGTAGGESEGAQNGKGGPEGEEEEEEEEWVMVKEPDIDARLEQAEREWHERVERAMKRRLDTPLVLPLLGNEADEAAGDRSAATSEAQEGVKLSEAALELLTTHLPAAAQRCYAFSLETAHKAVECRDQLERMWRAPTAFERTATFRERQRTSMTPPPAAKPPGTAAEAFSHAFSGTPKQLTPDEHRKAAMKLLLGDKAKAVKDKGATHNNRVRMAKT